LHAVLQRAAMFFDGVPEEVRRSLPDDTTEYMRPLPGAARMYPETDVPPIRITQKHLREIRLPEKPEEKHKRFKVQYSLNEEQINQLLSCGFDDDFERLAQQFPDLKNVIIRTYLNTFAELQHQGLSVENIDDHMLQSVYSALLQGRYAKEAIPAILTYLIQHPPSTLDDAVQSCGLQSPRDDEITLIIRSIVLEKKDFIKERGAEALGPLMGLIMKELRGKADGKLISKILHEEILKVTSL